MRVVTIKDTTTHDYDLMLEFYRLGGGEIWMKIREAKQAIPAPCSSLFEQTEIIVCGWISIMDFTIKLFFIDPSYIELYLEPSDFKSDKQIDFLVSSLEQLCRLLYKPVVLAGEEEFRPVLLIGEQGNTYFPENDTSELEYLDRNNLL